MSYKIKLTGKKGYTKSLTSHATFKTKKEAQRIIRLSKKVPSYKKSVKKYTIIKVRRKR